MPILLGTDGVQKMSKSLGNYVALSEDALTMYSKLEKTADSQIEQYFELLTNLPLNSLPENPRERNFWQLITAYREKVPDETYDYVFSIFTAAVIGENPLLFGFEFDNPLLMADAPK
jgi:tyrosyl-tRNA synthetase